MNYQTYPPHPDFELLVDCYWTLEVPAVPESTKQRIIPDGLLEMAFLLGDDIKRYTSETEFIIQPRAMVLGQTVDAFYIEPTGYVNSFAVRFYPYGFANLVPTPLAELANKETPIAALFGEKDANDLEQKIIAAADVRDRIQIIEAFLLQRIREPMMIDHLVKSTVELLISSQGSVPINMILKENSAQRRQLERKFAKIVGISPKQLGKVMRFQAALRMLLNEKAESLTNIAYKSQYYDQAHFIKDFREFTGINPKQFTADESMRLSSLFYK